MRLGTRTGDSRVLVFDIENRPLSYAGQDWTTAEITVISCKWVGLPALLTWTLEPYPNHRISAERMLSNFVELYDTATLVTGHYIRKHDLPIINGHLMEYDMPPLEPKLTCDTCLDLKKKKDMSRSLESLVALYGFRETKMDISQQDWRDANRLIPRAVDRVVKRCESDVRIQEQLRTKLLTTGHLNPPKVWRP